jgi:hypothetical protein
MEDEVTYRTQRQDLPSLSVMNRNFYTGETRLEGTSNCMDYEGTGLTTSKAIPISTSTSRILGSHSRSPFLREVTDQSFIEERNWHIRIKDEPASSSSSSSFGWAGTKDRSPFLERKGCPTSNL